MRLGFGLCVEEGWDLDVHEEEVWVCVFFFSFFFLSFFSSFPQVIMGGEHGFSVK